MPTHLSIALLMTLAANAYSADCNLPRGEVDVLTYRLYGRPNPQNAKTHIAPNKSCNQITLWSYIPGKNEKTSAPSTKECNTTARPNTAVNEGLVHCKEIKVYSSAEQARGKPRPYAYMHDGALVVKDEAQRTPPVPTAGVYAQAGKSSKVFAVELSDAESPHFANPHRGLATGQKR